MNTKPIERAEPIEDPNAMLEKALIEEYLIGKGYSHEDIKKLPAEMVEKLMTEASRHASLQDGGSEGAGALGEGITAGRLIFREVTAA